MNESKGHTWQEMVETSKRIAIEIKEGKYPEGTGPRDWRIYRDMAVYCPYIPLQITPSMKEEYDNPDLSRCPNCDEKAYDGRICHICGAKDIGE